MGISITPYRRKVGKNLVG